MKIAFIALLSALFLSGCAALKGNIFTSTATYFGVTVAENPTTQLYEAKAGYGRVEVALVPLGTNEVVPDVMMEINIRNFFQGGGIYQRLCIGSNAVQQPGATALFAKDSKGNSLSNAVDTVTKFHLLRPHK